MSIHHTTNYKEHAVKYYMKCKNYVKTCEVFDCERPSLMRWVKKYVDSKTLENKHRDTMSYKVTKEHLEYAMLQLGKNKMITMDELVKKIKVKYNEFDLSPQWLGKVLRDNYISRK